MTSNEKSLDSSNIVPEKDFSAAEKRTVENTDNLDAIAFKDGVPLHPQPTADPLDPLNFPSWKKHVMVAIVMWMYFLFTYITTTTVPAFPELGEFFGISAAQTNWTVAIPALGLAVGPLFWSSFADIYGRRIIFIIGTVIALVSTIGAAVAKDYGGYMAARFFQGFGVSPAATVGLAIINDLFFEYQRGSKIGLWVLALDMGLLVGPLIGGFMDLVSRFWIDWLTAIFFAVLLVAEVIFLPETLYPRTLMLTKMPSSVAGAITRDPEKEAPVGAVTDHMDLEMPRTTKLPFINIKPVPGMRHPKPWDSLVRFVLMFRYVLVPIVVGIYCYSWYWWLLSIITLIPAAYVQYSPQIQGLLFLGLILGTLFSEIFCSGRLSDIIVRRLAKNNDGIRTPEMRLWLAYPAALLSAIGLILWGISIDRMYHWMVGQVAFFLFAAGIQMGNTVVSAYIVDCYPLQSMSVITFYAVLINLSAFLDPFFIIPWQTTSGFTWCFAGQGIITFFASVPVLAAVHKFGPGLRRRCGQPGWVNPEEAQSPPTSGILPITKLAPSHFSGWRRSSHIRNSLSLFRYLIPHSRQQARARFFDFRHETIPYYRQRLQSRIYRFLVKQQTRRREKRLAGRGILALLRSRRPRSANSRPTEDVQVRHRKMTQPGASTALGALVGKGEGTANPYPAEARDRGARRKKLAGYLKAANELRQTYQQTVTGPGQHENGGLDESGIPGAFPDVAIVRSGDEEMILFPSYARRHVKQQQPQPTTDEDARAAEQRDGRPTSDSEDSAYWRKEWEKHEDDKAIVDVDVRGWIYAPHRGPMTRKNRLLVGLARQLSGVPAPPANADRSVQGQGQLSAQNTGSSSAEGKVDKDEEELVAQKAASILRKGQGEAEIAGRGGYSEDADADRGSIYSNHSRSDSPDFLRSTEEKGTTRRHPLAKSSLPSDQKPCGSDQAAIRKSWIQPNNMSASELAVANMRLMARLKPFLTNPVVGTPVTVFFYNDETSQSRNIVTNEAGHFSLRAALDFVPTDVRVLASEKLSATEEVRITEPAGVSLISDIDDTIKHSAVGSGAKEIFRNTFIRELGDLTIDGVKDWYRRLYDLGVKMHYVSNSPWQLYPVLVSYFAMAGLPPGSFHLKQYSGMLQGIFEPVAERKKSTLARLMQDFPERKFILVGDSGEADLEVYTDIVLAHPGRVIGIYIRDITSPYNKGFFDSAVGPLNGARTEVGASEKARDDSGHGSSKVNARYDGSSTSSPRDTTAPSERKDIGPKMGNLIDFGDDAADDQGSSASSYPVSASPEPMGSREKRSPPPRRPAKPTALRTSSNNLGTSSATYQDRSSPTAARSPPPLPAKPRRYSSNKITPVSTSSSRTSTASSQQSGRDNPSTSSTSSLKQTYIPSNVRQKVSSAYNKLPSASTVLHGSGRDQLAPPQLPKRPAQSAESRTVTSPHVEKASSATSKPPPPTPVRRGLTSYPVAAAQYATNRLSTTWYGSGEGSPSSASTIASDPNNAINTTAPNASSATSTSTANANTATTANKKEELWRRRWARAKEVLDPKGVELRTWREGRDVMEQSVGLVERVLREKEGKPAKEND
ncbi:MAG: hypothetical protein M1817_004746 [Caeruleum heppii]|nr:MAG: hypothetical protein M1817_004746 [Caeruleum heppii]